MAWNIIVFQSVIYLLLVCTGIQSNIQKKEAKPQSEVATTIWNCMIHSGMLTSKMNLKS